MANDQDALSDDPQQPFPKSDFYKKSIQKNPKIKWLKSQQSFLDQKVLLIRGILPNLKTPNSKPKVVARNLNQEDFFTIDSDSLKQLEEGKENTELILDLRKSKLSSDEILKDLEKQRIGTIKNLTDPIPIFKFPEKYSHLIEQRRKEGKLQRIVLIREGDRQIIALSSEQKEPPTKSSSNIKNKNSQFIKNKNDQIFCVISKYFPGCQKEEIALLTYIDEIGDISGSNHKKVAVLRHFTPWTLSEEKAQQIITSQKLVVFVISPKGHYLYLAKDCKKDLQTQNVVAFSCYCYVPQESLENLFPEEDSSKQQPAIYTTMDKVQAFDEKQYAVAKKMSSIVLTAQLELGRENILLGGVFTASDQRMNASKINTVKIKLENGRSASYFYLSQKGLPRLGVSSRIIQIEALNEKNIGSIENWKRIIAESRLTLIKDEPEGATILLHKEIIEDKPQWQQMLKNNSITPLAIRENDKFILYELDISMRFINEDVYEYILTPISSYIQKLLEQKTN
jgi:hypothetical protein